MAEKKTLARPYAKAAFEYAVANNEVQDWSSMLQTVAAMVKDIRVHKIISNPELSAEQRAAFFTEQNLFSESFNNFITNASCYGRLDLLPEISSGYELLKNNHNKEVQAQVLSADNLNVEQQQQVKSALANKLSKNVNVTFGIDQELIGGVLIRVGDLVIDGSVKGQLKKMLSDLVH